ncbi:MAG: DUF1700 domain-containing protein [Ruminococcus sp.]
MTKSEFLLQLKNRLSFLPAAESEKAVSFYSEAVDDRIENGFTEEEAVADLGDINEIVKNIELEQPISALVKNKIKTSKNKSENKTLWMILAICGFPLWFPLGIAFALTIFIIYLTIWICVFCLYAVLFAFGVTAIGGIIAGVVRCVYVNPANGLMIIGGATVFAGLFILLIKPVILLTKKFISLTGLIAKKIKGLFISDKEMV